jgi:acyl carrier protein
MAHDASPATLDHGNHGEDGDHGKRGAARTVITRVLSKVLGHELPPVRDDTPLIEGLGLDSTHVLGMLMDLEDELGIEFDFDLLEQENIETFGSVTDLVLTTLAVSA